MRRHVPHLLEVSIVDVAEERAGQITVRIRQVVQMAVLGSGAGIAGDTTELLRQSAEHCGWSPLQHAYYLDVQNRRPEYISTFVNELINWDKVWLQHARVCVFQREATALLCGCPLAVASTQPR